LGRGVVQYTKPPKNFVIFKFYILIK